MQYQAVPSLLLMSGLAGKIPIPFGLLSQFPDK
jgi:hypothetical protein